MKLEAVYFQNLAHVKDISTRHAQKENEIIIVLREKLERELVSKTD
jgi:hypothetical protein